MGFSAINELLDGYRKKLLGVESERKIIIDTITGVSGITLKPTEITIKKGEIRVTADTVTKNQLFIYKEKILIELTKVSGKTFTEIH